MPGDTQPPNLCSDAGQTEVYEVVPLTRPPDVTVRVPGSKSITNRALLCAALASGRSTLRRALLADDTRAMLDAIRAFGAQVTVEPDGVEPRSTIPNSAIPRAEPNGAEANRAEPNSATVTVTAADLSRTDAVEVFARQSGATSRLMLPAATLRAGTTLVDGTEQLRARPFGPQLAALRQLGATVEELGRPGFLPVRVLTPARGGPADISGDVSSQFASGLLMAGPLMPDGLHLHLTTDLVSRPYLDITRSVMAAFGVVADGLDVAAGRYRAADLAVEPDASSASYVFAAAITGGRITVEGLGSSSIQGDLGFVDLLERMGATVERGTDRTTVIGPTGPTRLRGIDVDLRDISDTAQTLAAVSVYADGPTRVRGIGFIRYKETDRLHAVVTELRRAGIDAVEHDDGFTIVPGAPRPTVFQTYDDHRMAMSLSLLGLRHPGIAVADPGCVTKTYPGFFADLEALAAGLPATRPTM